MLDPIDRFRIMRARRRWMRAPSPWRSRAFWVVLALLAGAVVVLTVFDTDTADRTRGIVDWVAERQTAPETLARDLARTHPVVMLGDVAGAPGPKRLAASIIEMMANGSGLDYVALEVGSDAQSVIDRYLDAAVEDASSLVGTRALPDGAGAGLLTVYRQVRALNASLGSDRRIRIIAIDSPDWPPPGAVAPSRLVPLFADRDEWMITRLRERIFDREETARVLVLVDGLRVLDASLRLGTRGSGPTTRPLLGRRLRSALPGRVASILVDAPSGSAGAWIGYRGGELARLLRTAAAGQPLAVPLRSGLPLTMASLDIAGRPGLEIGLEPPDAPLFRLADGYIRLPQ